MTLQKGQVTPQPVLTQYGYFAIQAVDVKENTPKDYAKSQDKYRSQVAQYLQEQAEQQAMQTATQNAKIVVKDPLLRAYRKLSEPNPALAGKVDPSTVADFQAALKTADYTTQAEINAQLALLYRQEKQLGQEIAALEAANSHAEDPQLRLMLGDAYRTSGQTDKALAQYQLASQDAYNDPNIHMQLQQAYKQMGKTADYTKEATWMADYAKRQKQNGGANGMPAGLNIQPSGGGGGNSPS
jgi:tetratricopeptide (TPR) repeat protein